MTEENYGTLTSIHDGPLAIIDFVQTEFIHGRQWTVLKIEDGSIFITLKSTPEGSFEEVKQEFRLTHKSFALLILTLTEADRQFSLDSCSLLEEILPHGECQTKHGIGPGLGVPQGSAEHRSEAEPECGPARSATPKESVISVEALEKEGWKKANASSTWDYEKDNMVAVHTIGGTFSIYLRTDLYPFIPARGCKTMQHLRQLVELVG